MTTPIQAPQSGTRNDEVLYDTDHARVTRKVLPELGSVVVKQAVGAQALRRLGHELAMLKRLAHVEGVAKLAEACAEPGTLVLRDDNAMSLAAYLRDHRLGVEQVLAYAQAAAGILGQVHKAGVIHKDIGPANLLIHPDTLAPTLIDFNIAANIGDETETNETQSGIAGTLAYMSPEQTGRTGRRPDQRSDLYSLGITLYEMLTQRKPFESTDLLELVHDHLVRVPDAPASVNPALPQIVSDLVMRLLEKEPDRRYQSAEGLRLDLARLHAALLRGDHAAFPLGEHDFARRLSPPPRPIGREAELGALQQALKRSIEGGVNCLLIAGAPGVGKSALMNELRPAVTAQHGWFVTSKFDQYSQDAAKAAVESLRALGRLLLAEPEEQVARHRERILKGLGSNAGFGPALLPEFVLLLGKQPVLVVSDPREAEARMLQATVDLLRSVATPERPVVIVMDDLQWAPPMSLRTLDTLVSSAEPIPGLLVIVAYRPNEVDASHPLSALMTGWEKLAPAPTRLELGNLAPDHMASLIGKMLRLADPEAGKLAAALHERTGGNPYDIIELINALREDNLLVPRDGLWQWEAAALRQYVGSAGASDILGRRIAKLSQNALEMLEVVACLGGEVSSKVLELVNGLNGEELSQRLAPSLEDGLLSTEAGEQAVLRFRHTRIHQAVFEGMSAERRREYHLRLARCLVAQADLGQMAAEQYLPVADALVEEAECRRVAGLFHESAARLRMLNYAVTERLLCAAIQLLKSVETPGDAQLLATLETEQHTALYVLAQHADCDTVYASIVARRTDPTFLADPAGIQMYSLINRGRNQDATDLGLKLLQELGLQKPADMRAAVAEGTKRLVEWSHGEEKNADFERPEVRDPQITARAKLLVQTANASYFCDSTMFAWLILEGKRLWIEEGPSEPLMRCTSGAPFLLVGAPQDYRGSYVGARHMIAVGEARSFGHATAMTRANYGFSAGHWVEPIENVIDDFMQARSGLMQAGNVTYSAYTYRTSDLLMDCAPTLEAMTADVNDSLLFADRTRNADLRKRIQPRVQLIQALHGKTKTPGGFCDESFDEDAYIAAFPALSLPSAFFHILRANSALIFNDSATLALHAAKAMAALPFAPGYYVTALARVMQAVALAEKARNLPQGERGPLIEELDATCLNWLRLRAADAPVNFLHLLRWVEAERSWAADSVWAAGAAFDAAVAEAALHPRPWHRALITERAAMFQFAQGMEHSARPLLAQACDLYEAWGAPGKVRELRRVHSFLRASSGLQRSGTNLGSATVDTEMVDMMAVLRASQALSSQTSLASLTAQVGKVLGTITGATGVQLIVHPDEGSTVWVTATSLTHGAEPVTAEQAGAAGTLPFSVFRYAERTGQVLVIDDIARDDRFSGDPYAQKYDQCSLMLVPILKQGQLNAMLVLENHQRRAAFSADRLDSVAMIAGQLAVSLDNALLYASLEKRVAERTAQLRQKTNDINAMLQNMPQGVLTVMNGGSIHPEYSAYLATILETTEIADRHVMQLLFSGASLGADSLSQVDAAIASVIGEDEMNYEFNSHLLATEFDKTMADGRVKSLALSWSPIANDEGTVDKLMLCVRDVTELKRLEAEANTRKRELQVIGEILAVSQEKFHEFIASAGAFIDENKRLIDQATEKNGETINLLFRNMHTIKGNARTYGLLGLTNQVHVTEQSYDDLRKSDEAQWQRDTLLAELASVKSLVDTYSHVNDTVLGRKGPGRRAGVEKFLMVEKDMLQQTVQVLVAVDRGDPAAMRDALGQVGSTLHMIGTQPLAEVLSGSLDSLPSLAQELGKEAPLVQIEDHGVAIRTQAGGLLKNLFTHLLRNSLDHGIEAAATRQAAGKPAAGRIDLQLSVNDGKLWIRLRDDGRGLAVGKIRQCAAEQNLITRGKKSTDDEVAQLIFRSGFSTAAHVTEVSGRGVGMDAVRGFLEKEGGSIALRFLDDREEADYRAFETVIALPDKYAASLSAAMSFEALCARFQASRALPTDTQTERS